jgi:hypothetical protein
MHIFFILSLYTISFLQAHYEDHRELGKPTKKLSQVRNWYRSYADFVSYEALGDRAISQENQLLVADMIAKLKMDDYCIETRAMSNYAQSICGRTEVFVAPSIFFGRKAHCYLYMSEDWFSALDQKEKEALLYRQLLVVKKNDIAKKFLAAVFYGFTTWAACYILSAFLVNRYTDPKAIFKVFGIYLFGTELYVLNLLRLFRNIEKEADLSAARSVGDPKPLISLLKKVKMHVEDPYSRFRFKKILQKVCDYILSFYYTHPSYDERIRYLEKEF